MKQIHAGLVCLIIVILAGQATFTQQLRKPDFRLAPIGRPSVDQRQISVPTSLLALTAANQQPGRQLRSEAPGRRLVDGTSQLKARQEQRGERAQPGLNGVTIPYWSDNLTYQGLDFTYRMVGTDPKKGSRITVIPTEIIPYRFIFPDGQVFDASTDVVDGQTAIQGIINSPIFQNYDFVLGGTSVGKTQYGDAFQRANFWNSVSTSSKDYHVRLGQPTVLPTQTIVVPDGAGFYYYDPFLNITIPFVKYSFFLAQEKAIRADLRISPQTLPIAVWGGVVPESSSAPGFPGASAWHGVENANGGVLTFIGASYGAWGFHDVYPLSHEVAEWIDDPFVDNYTPGWNIPFIIPDERCDSGSIASGLLEAADPVEFFDEAEVALPGAAYDYHVTEAMFIDFYTRSSQSRSVNGQYSMFEIGAPFGLSTGPSSPCVGSVQAAEMYIEFPGATLTAANGINNHEDVVGAYLDQQQHTHGFLWRQGTFTPVDYPGATTTLPVQINDSGLVVGYFVDQSGFPHGFLYGSGQWTRIDYPGATDSLPLGINSAGDIVGAYDVTQPITHGFVLRNGLFKRVDTPFGQQAEVTAIDNVGRMIGSAWDDSFNGPYSGFIGLNNNFTVLNMPRAQFTYPFDLNSNGMIVGRFDNGVEPYQSGFVYLFGYLHEVNSGRSITFVDGNNDRNEIVGMGFDFSVGRWKGYIGQLPIHVGN
ncbi:MAG TPA: hypothetical protein VLB68_01365 [Pyrinomonadaceae bacterium]|nr:hypothetical protein [Pyrinomonadaceae bacterium]